MEDRKKYFSRQFIIFHLPFSILRISNKWFWLGLAFVIKLFFFLYFLHQYDKSLFDFNSQVIGQSTGDTWTYLNPIDNFLCNGEYAPDFRMPGYGAIYLFFRFFFNPLLASNLLIVLQLLLASVSVYCLALTAQYIFKSEKYFFITFLIYLFSSYPSYFDVLLVTESFSISSLIFNIYFLIQYQQTRKSQWLFVSGFLLCWCIFLRPVFFPLLILQLFYLFFFFSKVRIFAFRKKLLLLLLFMLPFICAESVWVASNYSHHKRFIFLTQSINYPWADKDFVAVRDFVSAWGGDAYYEPNAEIFWFEYHRELFNLSTEDIQKIKFPQYIYMTKFNYDSLVAVKNYIKLSHDTTLSVNQRNFYQLKVTDKLNQYSQLIKNENPAVYYLYAPVKMLGRFIFQSGSHFWFFRPFSTLNIFEKYIKLFYSMLYWTIIILGSAGCFAIIIKHVRDFNLKFVITFIPLYFILVHPIFLRLPEERYIIPAYPFLTVIAVYVSIYFYQNLIKKHYV